MRNFISTKDYNLALKDDIEGVKKEIGTEEQFLESIIKSELFIKKYKKPIIALVAIAILGFVGYYGNLFLENRRIDSANALYSELLKNPNDDAKKAELKILMCPVFQWIS